MRLAQTRPFQGGEVVCTSPGVNCVATIKGLEAVFFNVTIIILYLAGIALFIMLLVGGFQYMLATGNPQKAEAARNTLTAAIAGIVLVAVAFLIIVLITTFTGVELRFFRITVP